ncbi:MAG: alginate lyase family protein [Candidatus Latescibacterota bacterium]
MKLFFLIPLVIACTNGTSDPTSSNAGAGPMPETNPNPSACAERIDCGVLATGLFAHPGALDSQEELDFVKTQIRAGAQPWKGEYDRLLSSGAARRGPHGKATINSSNSDANTSRDDAEAAYAQALLWYYSGDETYAERSIAILNSWADLQDFTAGSDQDKLQAGWIGAVFAPAAEIMRGYSGWAAADIASLQEMFKRAFYPQLNRASSWNGNVDLTQIDAMMAIAVFNEDLALFNAGVERWQKRTRAYFYLTADGEVPSIQGDGGNVPSFWSKPTAWVDGLTQETCRDNGHHAQFALGSAMHAAEVAWHQGVDLYSGETQRYTAVLELLATQLLTGDMQGTCADSTASKSLFDTWEIAYSHYHNRMGIDLPQTDALIQTKIRPNAPRAVWNLLYETLTHAGL